jgi:predicted metal-dependent phosphoesterase TrpH
VRNDAAVPIDMHSHSSASDGTDPPAEVMRRASEAGLDVIALTDHDTSAGIAAAAGALRPGLTLVPGMELSCRLGGPGGTAHSVHLLAYLFDPSEPDLAAECAKIRDSRLHRAQRMVQRLAGLGTGISWGQVAAIAAGGAVGRLHIARAMVDAGVIGRPEDAFTADWLAPGGRAYAARYALQPVRAIGLVRAAGGVPALAHPWAGQRGWKVPEEEIARLAAAGLAGIEVNHPDHSPAQRLQLGEIAGRLGLAALGSSDDHGSLTGHRLGCETTAPGTFERIVAQAAGAVPIAG